MSDPSSYNNHFAGRDDYSDDESKWSPWFRNAFFEGTFATFEHMEDFLNAVLSIFCVLCAGLASGLTLGLLSLDSTKLEIKCLVGTEDEKNAATALLPIVKQHHLLLVTLLLFNSMANESLPVFLGDLVPNWLAVILSVFLVLIFGEIIPTSLFTGPNQLAVAYKLKDVINFLMKVLYPIAYPISLVLDNVFGEVDEQPKMSRSELKALMTLQTKILAESSRGLNLLEPTLLDDNEFELETIESGRLDESISLDRTASYGAVGTDEDTDDLTSGEIQIMSGILKCAKSKISEVMIKFNGAFMISDEIILNQKNLTEILKSGFSRLPVYSGNNYQNVTGVLLVKTLIVINPQSNVTVGSLKSLTKPLILRPTYGLLETLALFRKGQSHLALVSADPHTARSNFENKIPQSGNSEYIGIVTLEDVVEEIIQDEIVDETDMGVSPMPGLSGRSKVLHNGVVLIKSNVQHQAKPQSLTSPTRSLTHFIAHSSHGADVFTPPYSTG